MKEINPAVFYHLGIELGNIRYLKPETPLFDLVMMLTGGTGNARPRMAAKGNAQAKPCGEEGCRYV